MTTTFSRYFTLLFLLFCGFSQAQIAPVFEQTNLEILGLKKVKNGCILISCSDKNSNMNATLITTQGKKVWSSSFEIPKASKSNLNRLEVITDSLALYIISQTENDVWITQMQPETGQITKPTYKLKFQDKEAYWYCVLEDLFVLSRQENEMIAYEVSSEGLTPIYTVLHAEEKYNSTVLQTIASNEFDVISSTYTLERDHSEMHLLLSKYDLVSRERSTKTYDLKLDYTSFTYNSSVDARVFGTYQESDAFYLLGKLDIKFKNKYPTQKLGDNFIGLWIAKFNSDLDLVYFSEIPFQYFEGYVPADVIRKPSVIALKEDFNGGLFVNINEIQTIIYGQRYTLYLDSLGLHRSIIGGKDEYNLMEYDFSGLRDAGRKGKIRLMNDDWSPYSTSTFNTLDTRNSEYSAIAKNTVSLSLNSSTASKENKSYNYLIFNEDVLYFEYLSRKKGTLRIYHQAY